MTLCAQTQRLGAKQDPAEVKVAFEMRRRVGTDLGEERGVRALSAWEEATGLRTVAGEEEDEDGAVPETVAADDGAAGDGGADRYSLQHVVDFELGEE